MPYRDDLEALEHRYKSLAAQAAVLDVELADARQLLAEATARRRLPVLDDLQIAAPCSSDWSKMIGDERVRFCGQCEKNVYNLSEMTRAEAEALLIAKEGKLCVSYFKRADGTVMTADCPVGVKRRRRRRRILAAAFGAMSTLAAFGAAWLGRHPAKAEAPTAKAVDSRMPPGSWVRGKPVSSFYFQAPTPMPAPRTQPVVDPKLGR